MPTCQIFKYRVHFQEKSNQNLKNEREREQQKAAPSNLLVVRQDWWRLVIIFLLMVSSRCFGQRRERIIPCIRIQSSTANVTATLHLNCNAFLCNRPRVMLIVQLLSLVGSPQLKTSSFSYFCYFAFHHFKFPKNVDMNWSPTSERSYFRSNKCFMGRFNQK